MGALRSSLDPLSVAAQMESTPINEAARRSLDICLGC